MCCQNLLQVHPETGLRPLPALPWLQANIAPPWGLSREGAPPRRWPQACWLHVARAPKGHEASDAAT